MFTRSAKIILLVGIALYYTLVVFNNLFDFGTNYIFVHHVLDMDTTIPGNHGMWRALHPIWIHFAIYVLIILWEAATAALLWMGVVGLYRERFAAAPTFNTSKRIAILALTLSLTMWLVAFLAVGGEWFLMWQSQTWNGQQEAFRMFVVVALVLLILIQPDSANQP